MTVRLIKHNVIQKWRDRYGSAWVPSLSDLDKINDEVIELYGKHQFEKAIEEMRAISELDSDVEIPTFEHTP